MLENAKKGSKENKGFYDEVLLEFVNKQLDAIEILSEYCESYFFFQLAECKAKLRLKLSDNAAHIYKVLGDTRSNEIKALQHLSPRPSSSKRYIIIKVCYSTNTPYHNPERAPLKPLINTNYLCADVAGKVHVMLKCYGFGRLHICFSWT